MKFQYTCVFLLALFAASQAFSASWGKRNGTDFLVLRQTEVRQPLKNNYWNVNVNYNGQYFITFINVIDNFRNSSGAAPSIYSGGVGYRNTVVTLKSQVSRGLNSTVEIWARR
ncbi:uncharacterized protein LOC117784947 [Drosophila innubila]|uniref:uncharacterized protein LOC117784947 n=1 Tax=Drosophila innubila TaxID=198719 RepID=UPI00148E0158|nr:uncharacterized protein LOC117784947 [Drosophila innubila]